MYYKLASLILNSSRASDTISEIFIAQPDTNKEVLAGKLFILIEIRAKKSEVLKVINFLVNNLNHNYYQNEKIILRERISSLKIEHILESSLAKTNKDLVEFLAREKIKTGPTNFNITIGVIHENNLHFSNIGKNKVLLIYRDRDEGKKNAHVENEEKKEIKYKITDIGQNSILKNVVRPEDKKNKQPPKPTKLFSHIVSGQIPRLGYCLFTNEALPEYLSHKQLIKIVTKLSPRGAIEQIKNTLSKINAYVPFLGIIIKSTTGLKPASEKKETKTQPSAQDSVTGLSYTEEETEKLLSAPGIINFKKWLKVFPALFYKIKRSPKKTNEKLFLLKDKIILKRKQPLKKILFLFKNIAACLVNLIFYLFKIFTNKKNLIEFLNEIKLLWIKFIDKLRGIKLWLKKLSKKNKILFAVSSVCLILFIISLAFTGLKNKKVEEQQSLENLIKIIEQKQNQIDAHLLYSNEEGAKKILNELKKLLNKLPQETEKEIITYNEFKEKHEIHLEKIRHVIKIENAKELADFINLNSQANVENIILAENKIYAGDSKQKTIYTLELSNNLVTAITNLNQPVNALKYPILDKDKNIFYLNNNSVIELNAETEKISNLTIALPEGARNIVAAADYNNNLYLLDSQNNQVYRYKKSSTGFPQKYNWINEQADFKEAISLSIDGHIYILKNNGQVLKYLKGQLQDFKLESIEPAFESPTKIIISPDLEFIYILEPINQRLAIFDKTGDFLMQYKSDSFTNLKDFTVNEISKKIYFLNGNSVYEIEGMHFEE